MSESAMQDITILRVTEPEHYPVIVIYKSGVARKYRVIADGPEEAVAAIDASLRKLTSQDGEIVQLFAERRVQACTTTFVKVLS